jgi:endonuclease/exonuclease/phosphatase family metal-dependent hydrolase
MLIKMSNEMLVFTFERIIMKNILLGLIIGATIMVGSCSNNDHQALIDKDETQELKTLRVLCYNIHHANPPSKPDDLDLDAIARVINKEKPDIVALQEVDVNTNRSGKINQAKLLAEKTGMKAYFFAKAINYGGGEYGVAILSKYEILGSQNYPLPDNGTNNPEPRVLATARIRTPSGFEFMFGNTHLEVREEENRLMQMEEIGIIANSTSLPFIIAGDFNAIPQSKTINKLDYLFERTCEPCAPTIPQINPTRAIDFIAFRPTETFKVIEHRVIQETYASDHLPVFVVLQIQK